MSFFTGKFYFVTRYSLYQINVKDFEQSPEVMKVAVHNPHGEDHRPLRNPVGGVLRTGFFLGISDHFVAKYNNPVKIGNGKPRVIIGSRKMILGSQSGAPIAFFDKRSGPCEDCFEYFAKDDAKGEPYDPRWQIHTIAVLKAIGLNHPRITLATGHRWTIPRHILDCLVLPPGPVVGAPTNNLSSKIGCLRITA